MNLGPFWTDERIAELHRLAAEGLSAAEIGRKLGCSKNAVIGKLHRVKVRTGITPERNSAAPKRKYIRRPKLEGVAALPPPPSRPCGILEVTGCKWAIGSDNSVAGGHLFCNSEKHDERYCTFHAQLSRASYSTELVTKTVKQALKAHKAAA